MSSNFVDVVMSYSLPETLLNYHLSLLYSNDIDWSTSSIHKQLNGRDRNHGMPGMQKSNMDYWEPLTNKRSENSQSENVLMKFL